MRLNRVYFKEPWEGTCLDGMIALGYMERSEALSLAGYGEHENYLIRIGAV